MLIQSLSLKNFRNIASLEITPSPGINVIYGENAQGKTNILESLYYLSLLSAPRATANSFVLAKKPRPLTRRFFRRNATVQSPFVSRRQAGVK